MSTSIWWIRRDLRLTDAPALCAALDRDNSVIPLFVLDPQLLHSSYNGEKRTAFLFAGLRALDADLRQRGSRLIVRAGDPAEQLAQLCHEQAVSTIYAEEDISPYARKRDAHVANTLSTPLHLTQGITIRSLHTTRKDDGLPYTVFTPFSKKWKAHEPIRRSAILKSPKLINTDENIASLAIPEEPVLPSANPFPASEQEAKHRLSKFVQGDNAPIFDYANQRDRPDLAGTAQLSPYLRFGMLSARMAAVAAYEASERADTAEARKSAEVWLNELIWREFYITILDQFPHVRRGCFRPEYDALTWINDPDEFAAWCAGQTGYPFIDAAMRQLSSTGWMHNRARMAVASFLVKDLLIDWRWGERWFMKNLLDGDPAANNGGWQWTAGVGTDASPYFRVFNPITQGQKFDPQGDYVRKWVPELKNVPDKFIHEPWLMPKSEQIRAGCAIGKEYTAPMVDHALARDRVLEVFKAVKSR